MTLQDLTEIVKSKAALIGVDANLAVAIMTKESSGAWPRGSSRFEPKWSYFFNPEVFCARLDCSLDTEKNHQATSWGPMHVMGSVARELGFTDPLPLLFQPDIGSEYGCKKLKTLVDKYVNEPSAIAAYNAGSPRKIILNGSVTPEYTNQAYVNEVLTTLAGLRAVK